MLLCIGRLGSTDPTMHKLAVRAPYRMSNLAVPLPWVLPGMKASSWAG